MANFRSVQAWQFAPRFRRNAFGWKSDAPIRRIREALSEIKRIARKDPPLGGEGAVVFLERLSPALMQVDGSSGSLGRAVNQAIETLIPIIVQADVDLMTRRYWLERLWRAIEADEIPYLEALGDFWGELCAQPPLASEWADELRSAVQAAWRSNDPSGHYFEGTNACLSALYAAGRFEELLSLLDSSPIRWWHERRWGVKALVALRRKADAIRYAESSRGLNEPDGQISAVCEDILLSSGLADEAYRRYGLFAYRGVTCLATFRAIVKKYPHKAAAAILRDLINSEPEREGRWFAAAMDAKLYDLAAGIAGRSPVDPRMLVRAAKDQSATRPKFSAALGRAALIWIARGYVYEISAAEILGAWHVMSGAARMAGMAEEEVKTDVREIIDTADLNGDFLHEVLGPYLSYGSLAEGLDFVGRF